MDYHLTRQQGRRHYVVGAETACGSRWGALETDPMLTTCPDCLLLMGKHREASAYTADTFRRAELARELATMGAVTIQVEDLGAALEALRAGTLARPFARLPAEFEESAEIWRAAHEGRVAVGDWGPL